MNKILLALAMVALAASLAWGAYSNVGDISATAGTSAVSATWTGASADWISVYAESADVTFTIVPDRDDEGTPFTVKAGQTKTLYVPDLYGFTITRSVSTAVQVCWGVR